MPASTERSPWDFSSVYELLENFSTQDAAPGDHEDLGTRPRGSSLSTRQSTGLGDLGPVWQFLYAGRERPPDSVAKLASLHEDATDAYLQRTLDAATLPPPFKDETYNSDGAADSAGRKNVTWKDEPEVVEPSDETTTAPSSHSTLKYEFPPAEATKEQRRQFWKNMLLTQAMSRHEIQLAKKLERAERRKVSEHPKSVRKTKSDVESESEIRIIRRPTPAKKASFHSRPGTPSRDASSTPRYNLRSSGNVASKRKEQEAKSRADITNEEVAIDVSLAGLEPPSNNTVCHDDEVLGVQRASVPTASPRKMIKSTNGKRHELIEKPNYPELAIVHKLEPSPEIDENPLLSNEQLAIQLGTKVNPIQHNPEVIVRSSKPLAGAGEHSSLGAHQLSRSVQYCGNAEGPLRPAAILSQLKPSAIIDEHTHSKPQKLATPIEIKTEISDVEESAAIVNQTTHLKVAPSKGKQPIITPNTVKPEKSVANGTSQSSLPATNTSSEQLPKYLEALSPKKKRLVDLSISALQPVVGLSKPIHQVAAGQNFAPQYHVIPSQVKQTLRKRHLAPPISHQPCVIYAPEQMQHIVEQQALYYQHYLQFLLPKPQFIPNPHPQPPPFTTSRNSSAPYLQNILRQSFMSLTDSFSKKSKSFNILPKEDRDLHLFLRLVHEFPADKKWLTKPVHLVDHTASPSGKSPKISRQT
jgi:hypothetical protein